MRLRLKRGDFEMVVGYFSKRTTEFRMAEAPSIKTPCSLLPEITVKLFVPDPLVALPDVPRI